MKISVPIQGNLPPTLKKKKIEIEVGDDILGAKLQEYASSAKAAPKPIVKK